MAFANIDKKFIDDLLDKLEENEIEGVLHSLEHLIFKEKTNIVDE